MIFFYIFHVMAYTVYPTINNSFIYPLSNLGLENTYNCSANGWEVIQSIQQSNTNISDEIISITLGQTDEVNQSYFAGVLSRSTINIYQVIDNGTFQLFQYINYNSSVYNCSNMIFQNNSLNLVIMCTQNEQISILFYQNQQLSSLNISSISINVEDLQSTNITEILNNIALTYIFTNYSIVYFLGQQNGIITSISQFWNQTGSFIQIFVSYQWFIFGITKSEFFLDYDVLMTSNSTFISLAALYSDYQKNLITIGILEKTQIVFHIFILVTQYENYITRYMNISQEYNNIYLTNDYIVLTNQTNIVIHKQENFQQIQSIASYKGFQQSFGPINQNLLLQTSQNRTLSLYQFNKAYLLNQQPQGSGNLTINCFDSNTNQQIINQIQYQTLQNNDTGIYVQDNSIQQANSSFYKVYVQKLSQYFIGPNISYSLSEIDCQYQEIDSYYNTALIDTQVTSIQYFDAFNIYIQAYFDGGYLKLQYLQLNQKQDMSIIYVCSSTLNFTPTGMKIFQQYQYIDVLVWTKSVMYLYTTTFFSQQITFQQMLNLTQILNQTQIVTQQVQIIDNILYVLCSIPNQLLKITINRKNLTLPIIMSQLCVYNSIESNYISYPDILFINCQNQLILLRNSLQSLGYSIILRYPYPQSQQALIGPIDDGIYFYFYNTSTSSLYFMNKFYLYTLQQGFKLKLQQVYTSLQLNSSLTYAYSNKFFYVLQYQNGQSFISVYKSFYQQQSALQYSQYVANDAIQLVTSIYMSELTDLTALVTTTSTKNFLYFHDVTQAIMPIFNMSLYNSQTQVLNIGNQATSFNFSQEIIFQQEFLQINSTSKLLNQVAQNLSGYTKINVSDYFQGSIINYSVNCAGCSNYSYVQPLQQQEYYNISQVTQSISINNYIYASSGTNVVQIDLRNKNTSAAYQTISSFSGLKCGTLFVEIFSQNPGWLCISSKLQQLIIFQYNQQNNNTYNLTINMSYIAEFAYYTDGFVQIQLLNDVIESYPYTVLFYSYLNNVQSYQYVINNTLMPINKILNVIPLILKIDYSQFMQYFGILCQLTSDQMMITLFIVNISNNSVINARVDFQAVRDIDLSYVSSSTLTGQQLETISDGNLTYLKFAIATNFNTLIIQLAFENSQYLYAKNLCQLNQVNFTAIQFDDFSNTGLNNLVITQQSMDDSIILNLFELSQCSDGQMLQSIGQVEINQKVMEYTFINLVKQNLLAVGTFYNLFLFSVQSTLDLQYQLNQSQASFNVTAFNQLSSSQQNFKISLNQTVIIPSNQSSSGFKWYWILLIIVVSLIIIAIVVVIIVKRKQDEQQQNAEFEFTSEKIQKSLIK